MNYELKIPIGRFGFKDNDYLCGQKTAIMKKTVWILMIIAMMAGCNEARNLLLKEAAEIDGANRWKQTIHVTLPGISTTIITKLLLDAGHMLSVGYEKIILLYNEKIYETADVISSFTYRRGLLDFQWSFSTAVGLFNSVINFILIIVFNKISKKVSEVGLW